MSTPIVVTPEGPHASTEVASTPAPAPLGRAAAMGFMLMSGQSLITRVLTFAAQIVLARVLTKGEFGVFNIAMAVVNYSNMSQQIGVREVLIARQKKFHLWQNTAWWISNAAGLAAGIATALAAPVIAWVYQDTSLVWLLLIMAAAQPLYNVTLVQEAKLQIDMRFKRLAAGQFMQGALGPASQVALALAHCGSYALVLPRLIVGVAKWWFFRSAAPVRVRRDPQFRLWKYILAPGVLVLVTNLAYNIGPSVPILMLGHVGGAGSQMGKEFAGVFGFAYNLSLQSIMLLGMQIDSILFPTLGRMAGDPVRQRGALLRAGHALAAVMAPVCLFQIVAARPIILLVFGAKWEFAVVPFQIMSVGMLFAGAFAPAQSLLQAQVRFGKKLFIAVLWNVISGIVSAAGILWAPPEHAVDAAAVGLAVGYIGYGIHNCISATRPIGGNALDVLRILAMPCVVGLLAAGIAMGADYYATPAATGMLEHLAAWGVTHWPRTIDPAHADELRARVRDMLVHMFRISVLGGAGGVSFLALLRTLAPGVWEDMMSAAGPIIRRVRRALPRPLRGKAE